MFSAYLFLLSALANASSVEDSLLPESIVNLGPRPTLSDTAILVDKSQRKLMVWKTHPSSNRLEKIREYDADLGAREGDKLRRDDKRTPEGIYFLGETKTQPEIPFDLYGSRAFTTNYPNIFDRLVGKTGSGIWLHAVPDDVPLNRGSRGCVVLRNESVLDIENFVRPGSTPFIVEDQVQYTTPIKLNQLKSKVLSAIGSWKSSWETKQHSDFMAHYHPRFNSQGMNTDQWSKYKKRLFDKYENIEVEVSSPLVIHSKGSWIVRFFQRFQSESFEDYGQKTLYLKEDEPFKLLIVAEDWKPEDRALVTSEIAMDKVEQVQTSSMSEI